MSRPKREVSKRCKARVPTGYTAVLADVKPWIVESRHRALAAVNRELVSLYWHIGRVIVQQQETANWGDAVVEKLSADLRIAFPRSQALPGNAPSSRLRLAYPPTVVSLEPIP